MCIRDRDIGVQAVYGIGIARAAKPRRFGLKTVKRFVIHFLFRGKEHVAGFRCPVSMRHAVLIGKLYDGGCRIIGQLIVALVLHLVGIGSLKHHIKTVAPGQEQVGCRLDTSDVYKRQVFGSDL